VWVESRNKASQSSLLLMVGMTLGARYVRITLVVVAMPWLFGFDAAVEGKQGSRCSMRRIVGVSE
jgi:hypothetical protein